jgi:DNA-binding response OmpR family regulator
MEASLLPPTGTEAILLVDRDEDISGRVATLLRNSGYTVRCAHADSPALWTSLDTDLLVTDAIDVVERVRKEHPSVPLIFTGEGATSDEKLERPYSPLELARRIRQRLDEVRTHARTRL